MKYTKKKNVCARACVCVCVCVCVCACVCACLCVREPDSQTLDSAAFVSQLDTVGGVRARRHRLESAPFSQALVRRYCSLRPGSGCDQALVADCGPKSETPAKNMNSAIAGFPPQGPQHPPLLRSLIYCVACGRRVILPLLFDRVLGSV